MGNYIRYKDCSAKIDYDVHTGVFYGTILHLNTIPISFKGNSLVEIEKKFEAIVDNYIATDKNNISNTEKERKEDDE